MRKSLPTFPSLLSIPSQNGLRLFRFMLTMAKAIWERLGLGNYVQIQQLGSTCIQDPAGATFRSNDQLSPKPQQHFSDTS